MSFHIDDLRAQLAELDDFRREAAEALEELDVLQRNWRVLLGQKELDRELILDELRRSEAS